MSDARLGSGKKWGYGGLDAPLKPSIREHFKKYSYDFSWENIVNNNFAIESIGNDGANGVVMIGCEFKKGVGDDIYNSLAVAKMILTLLKIQINRQKDCPIKVILCGDFSEVINQINPAERFDNKKQLSRLLFYLRLLKASSYEMSKIDIVFFNENKDNYKVLSEVRGVIKDRLRNKALQSLIKFVNENQKMTEEQLSCYIPVEYRGDNDFMNVTGRCFPLKDKEENEFSDKLFSNLSIAYKSDPGFKKDVDGCLLPNLREKNIVGYEFYTLLQLYLMINEFKKGRTIKAGFEREYLYDKIFLNILEGKNYPKLLNITKDLNPKGLDVKDIFGWMRYKKKFIKEVRFIESRNKGVDKLRALTGLSVVLLLGAVLWAAAATFIESVDHKVANDSVYGKRLQNGPVLTGKAAMAHKVCISRDLENENIELKKILDDKCGGLFKDSKKK